MKFATVFSLCLFITFVMVGFECTYELFTIEKYAGNVPAAMFTYTMDISAILMGIVTYEFLTDKKQ